MFNPFNAKHILSEQPQVYTYKNRDSEPMDVYLRPHESLFSFYLVIRE